MLPRIDPRRANYPKCRPTYWTVANAVLILLAMIHVCIPGKALGWPIGITRVEQIPGQPRSGSNGTTTPPVIPPSDVRPAA